MTKQQLEKRRKVVKIVAVSLPLAGFTIPLVMGIKNKDWKSGLALGVMGLLFGGLIGLGVAGIAMPSREEQQKIK